MITLAEERSRRTIALTPDQLPRSVDAETGLIDAALDHAPARELALSLPAGAITMPDYQPLLQLMKAAQADGETPDRIALLERARGLGMATDALYDTMRDVEGAQGATEDGSNAEAHARIIRERYEQRLIIQRVHATLELMVAKPGDSRHAARRLVESMLDFAADVEPGYVHASLALSEAYEDAQRRASGDQTAVIRTGCAAIDGEPVGGLEPGDLGTWVMVSGHGKTAALALIALRASIMGTGVGVVSAEMIRRQIARRWASLLTGLPFARLKAWDMSQDEQARAVYAHRLVQDLPLYIDDQGTPALAHTLTQTRRLVQRHPEIRLVLIDYVTLIQGTGGTAAEAHGQVIRALKRLAKELKIAIVALVQPDAKTVERRGIDEQMPELADIAWCQEFRNQSDLVVTGYRPGEALRQKTGERGDDSKGWFMVRKSRNSAGGRWSWGWHGPTMGFDGGCWDWFGAQYSAATPRLEVMR